MIRISVTELESFRYWKNDEDATLADLVAELRRKETPTKGMEAGRAWAKVMERAREGGMFLAEADGWTFRFEVDAELALPAVRELKAEVVFLTPVGPVTLVGKVDGIDGAVHDQKLTERWDAEKYIDSLQWRAYLLMFEAKAFTYDVFVGRYKGREVTITEYHPLTFYAYPQMERDVAHAVSELAEVIARHLPERVTA